MKILLRGLAGNGPIMTTPAKKEPGDEVEVKNVDTSSKIGYTMASMVNTPYRQLQYLGKMCGVPCNLKKEELKMAIKSKKNGQNEELDELLKRVREERLQRKNQRRKALENSKVKIESVKETNNNQAKSISVKAPERSSELRKLLNNMTKMSSAPNVTIQKTNTHTHYRVVNPKCLGVSVPGSSVTQQSPGTRVRLNPESGYPTVIKYTRKRAMPINVPYQSNRQASCSTVTKTHWVKNPFGYTKVTNCYPPTAISVRETLLQQYQKNSVGGEQVKRIVENEPWTEAIVRQHRELMKFQPLPSFQSLTRSKVSCCNIHSYQAPASSSHLYNIDPQTTKMNYYMPKQSPVPFLGGQQQNWSFGGFQSGIQRASTPFHMDLKYEDSLNCNNVPMTNVEPLVGIHSTYSGFNESPTTNNLSRAQAPGCEVILNEVTPSEVTPPSPIIDVTKISMGSETEDDTDLGLLANMALTKSHEVIDETRNQQNNNGLLMINDNLLNIDKNDLVGSDSKTHPYDIPTWNNFLEQMSDNLSPGITNNMVVAMCKYGCHMPCHPVNRQRQLEHEEHCLLQPKQCPLLRCTYVGQLRSITTHMLNDHYNIIRSHDTGSYFVDLSDGKCSFEMPMAVMNDCPKKICFPQLVDGRLFFIIVIGNFESMQAIIYAQYVNDYRTWKSHVVLEVVRKDGVPFQYKGEVFPLSTNSMHIISRRKCLIFNLNHQNWTQNSFMLHAKIDNFKG